MYVDPLDHPSLFWDSLVSKISSFEGDEETIPQFTINLYGKYLDPVDHPSQFLDSFGLQEH
jgi:hypothetical protein